MQPKIKAINFTHTHKKKTLCQGLSKRVRDDHSINWWSSLSGHPSRIRKLYPTASPTGRTLRQENNVPIYFQMGKMEGFFPTLGKCLGRNRVISKGNKFGVSPLTKF